MKLAIAISKGRVAPLFDTSRRMLLLELDDNETVTSEELTLEADGGFPRVRALLGHGVETLICGAISRELSAAFEACGVDVRSFVSGDVERVVEAFLAGTLHSGAFCMPGCCGLGPRYRGGRSGHET